MNFEELKGQYAVLWNKAEIKSESLNQVIRTCQKIVANEAIYREIQYATLVPWYMVAAIHNLESTMDFNACLHNGDPWNKPTTHVPKGRGPFRSFSESAIDALKMEGLDGSRNWTLERILYECEMYNGSGYLKYHPDTPSPYLWANTTLSTGRGKYVEDGKFHPEAPNDDQIGVACVLKWLHNYSYIELKSEVLPPLPPSEEKKSLEIVSWWGRFKVWARRLLSRL